MTELNPHTPVIIGVGQIIDRLGEDGFEALSAVDLAVRAASSALADTGVVPDTPNRPLLTVRPDSAAVWATAVGKGTSV